MPNWCENRVTVSGEIEDVQRFRKTVEGSDHHGEDSIFSFHRIIPMPEDLIGTCHPPELFKSNKEVDEYNQQKEKEYKEYGKDPDLYTGRAITYQKAKSLNNKYGYDNWYCWSISNWGTKWQPSKISIGDYDADEILSYSFNTAWGPPEEIFWAIKEQFPKLNISWFYDEPGMEVSGYLGKEN